MNFEFRHSGTYVGRPQYHVTRVGERKNLGFISARDENNPELRFFGTASTVLTEAELREIANFVQKVNSGE